MFLRPPHLLRSTLCWIPKYTTTTTLQQLVRGISTNQEVSLTVCPENALVDERLTLCVDGLKPKENVTLCATLEQHSKKRQTIFESLGHFRASPDGRINLATDPCLSGTYTGIDAMGLFWSMRQVVGKYGRVITKDATQPLDCTVTVFQGHISSDPQHSPSTADSPQQPLVTKLVRRWFMKPGVAGVRRIPINDGRLRGSLFIPGGKPQQHQQYPAVIDLFGSAGALIESRGALLASHGFVTLSLAYFCYKDLPLVITDVDFEYFEEAVKWLANHPQVSSVNGIGVLGTSLGGVIALYMAKQCPQVSAVININGLPVFFVLPIRHNGKPIPYCCTTESGNITVHDDGSIVAFWKLDESKQFLLDETNRCKILTLISSDDQVLYTSDFYLWLDKLPPSKRQDIQYLEYEGAGHLLEPPYTPLFHCVHSAMFGGPTVFGGKPRQHALAQEMSWAKIIEFFTEQLLK